MKASLQGFKEYVQTGIPVVVGNIVRVNGQLEVGALTESVTVTTEAALLKTDKADVSVDLQPEDVINLPLNQYRNYQTLMNLVPGATPPVFQNAQTDTPGRALTTNVNGTNRNNNVTRIDGAASINVWLPHHAGYIAPVETIENVNISTNSFDAAQGMTGGAAMSVPDQVGHQQPQRLGVLLPQPGRAERPARLLLDPTKLDSSVVDPGRHRRRPDPQEPACSTSAAWERNHERNSRIQHATPCRPRRCATGDFSEVLALNPAFRIYDPADRQPRRHGPIGLRRTRVIPANRISDIAKKIQAMYPAPNDARHEQRPAEQLLFVPRSPKAIRDNYDGKVNWNRTPRTRSGASSR